MNGRLPALLGVALLLAAVTCADPEQDSEPRLSSAEALRYYVEWMCDDPQAQIVQLVEAPDTLEAVYQDGTWRFAYHGDWYVFYRGPVINASMRELTRTVIPDSPTDEAQAASRCRSLTG